MAKEMIIMSPTTNPSPRPLDDLPQMKRQARELLERIQSGEPDALTILQAHQPETPAAELKLTGAQFLLARKNGFASWPKLKAFVEERRRAKGKAVGAPCDAITLQSDRSYQLGWIEPDGDNDPAGGGEHTLGVTTQPGTTVDLPPSRVWFLEPKRGKDQADWDNLLDEIRERKIPGLYSQGTISDERMPEIGQLHHLRFLDLSRSENLTDAGLKHVAQLSQLEYLHLTNCEAITDQGLDILAQLPHLRVLRLSHNLQLTDAAIAHLAQHQHLELVALGRTSCGDGALRTLAGKPTLTHLAPGWETGDAGMALLPEFPALATWSENRPTHKINEYANPTVSFLELQGKHVTDASMVYLEQLEGVDHLNMDSYYKTLKHVTPKGALSVMRMPRLSGLPLPGYLMTDEICRAVADMPHITSLGFWEAAATEDDIKALAQAKQLKELGFGAFHGLTPDGLAALAQLPKLSNLSIGSKKCPDEGLACLKNFQALKVFWFANENIFTDEAFQYVAQAPNLETLVNMYVREYDEDYNLITATTDRSTEYLAQAKKLKAYHVWGSFITDRSLEILASMKTLEDLLFYNCPHLTNEGVAQLTSLPRLRKLDLQANSQLTEKVVEHFDRSVQVNYQPPEKK